MTVPAVDVTLDIVVYTEDSSWEVCECDVEAVGTVVGVLPVGDLDLHKKDEE